MRKRHFAVPLAIGLILFLYLSWMGGLKNLLPLLLGVGVVVLLAAIQRFQWDSSRRITKDIDDLIRK
jgi:hypothetical protein